jgi:hypothetical protein
VTSAESINRAADCAPYADSNLTLKEQISKLDDIMVLDDGNGDESDNTNHE